MTFIIGLTGGIGSGKTLASDHFAKLGVPVIDTDLIAREIVEKGSPVITQLAIEFGQGILNKDGSLNREALREIAFSNLENKKRLDAITHPAIQKLTEQAIKLVNNPYCIVVIPLLNKDSNFMHILQHVITVQSDEEIRIKRVQQRSELSKEEVKRIIKTQISDKERVNIADDVIENNGSKEDIYQQVNVLHQYFLQISNLHTD